ncbi:2-nitropropane dioxygenase [Lactobacillus sp. S2-2]|uniref:NAD(P)H-dependent flavin oxidoreductase n=1 Tax=Lactobacillus sp. S2-2 TaxID=2692917 RepID=UPI001F1730D3|nr:nitronate monooxygenase [Lactobacillus sp. S2-2]MCF6514583.1 2-nitropropane dioxygenase [Lactobacillus sp. S2-2]
MTNKITDILNIKYPIIQASMNWLTDANLVASVSNAGGLGVLGPNAGRNSLEEDSMETLKNEIIKTKKLTSNPFAVNLMLTSPNGENKYAKRVFNTAIQEGVNIFIVSGIVDDEISHLVKDNNSILIIREIDPTANEAKRAEKLGADIIIATGDDEGGVIPTSGHGTFTTIPRIVDAVNIPVIGAGGIDDIRGIRAAFALGAQGVYLGTRFIATKENRADKAIKNIILNSNNEDILYAAPNQRSIKNKISQIWADEYKNGAKDTFQKTRIQGGTRTAMLEGKIDDGVISVGLGIDQIHDIPSVKELINRLMIDFK